MPILFDFTAEELFDRLSILGAEVLSKTIDKLQDGTLTREKQNHDEATHVSMINKDLGKLDFNKTDVFSFNIKLTNKINLY